MALDTRELAVWDDLITPPTIEPIDLEEVKRHLRFTTTSEDTLLDTYIAAARQYFEHITGRQLMAATYERRIEGFPISNTDMPYPVDLIELAHPPLLSVVSVTHAAEGSPAQTPLVEGTDYDVDAPSGPFARRGFVRPIAGGSWPTVSGISSVRIRYQAGYGSQPGDVPELVKSALYFLVGHLHKFRAEVYEGAPGSSIQSIPLGADAILKAFKYTALSTLPPLRTTWV